jgi:hypothetical protein
MSLLRKGGEKRNLYLDELVMPHSRKGSLCTKTSS